MALHNPILDQAKKESAAPTGTAPVASNVPVSSDKLAAVEEAMAASTTRIVSTIKDLEVATKASKTQTEVATAAISQGTAAAQIINTAADTANLSAQNATIEAFEAFGGQEAQVALSEELSRDQQLTGDLLDEKLAIVGREHTGIQIIDNIINSFASSQVDQTIQAAQNKQAQTQRELANISASTESIARTNALTKKTLNEGVIKANYDAIAAEGSLKASQQELKNISANSDNMVRLVNMEQKQVSNLMTIWRTENEAAQVKLSQERMVLAREQMAITREKMKLEIPAAEVALERSKLALTQAQKLGPTQIAQAELNLVRSTKEHADLIATQDIVVESVQRSQVLTGLPVEDTETILFSIKKGGASGAKYIRLQEMGAVPDLKIGNTPFEAIQNLRVVAPEGQATPTKGTEFLGRVTELIISSGTVPDTEEGMKQRFNSVAETLIDTSKANIVFGDATNPFQAPPMTVLEQHREVQDSILYQKVIKALELKETQPQKIVDQAIAAVIAKTISPEEAAAGIESIFEAAAAYNNTQDGGLRRIGLPNQESYNTDISLPIGFFGKLTAATRSIFTLAQPGEQLAKLLFKRKLTPSAIGKELVSDILPTVTKTNVDLTDSVKVKELLIKLLNIAPEEMTSKEAEDTNTDHTPL